MPGPELNREPWPGPSESDHAGLVVLAIAKRLVSSHIELAAARFQPTIGVYCVFALVDRVDAAAGIARALAGPAGLQGCAGHIVRS